MPRSPPPLMPYYLPTWRASWAVSSLRCPAEAGRAGATVTAKGAAVPAGSSLESDCTPSRVCLLLNCAEWQVLGGFVGPASASMYTTRG